VYPIDVHFYGHPDVTTVPGDGIVVKKYKTYDKSLRHYFAQLLRVQSQLLADFSLLLTKLVRFLLWRPVKLFYYFFLLLKLDSVDWATVSFAIIYSSDPLMIAK
jgi:hypothetical protein